MVGVATAFGQDRGRSVSGRRHCRTLTESSIVYDDGIARAVKLEPNIANGTIGIEREAIIVLTDSCLQ